MNECDVYRRVKAEHQRLAGLLQPLAIPEWKFDHIEMDFVTGFPKSKRGNDAIFVVIDKLTKVAHFFPIKESIQQLSWQSYTPPGLSLCMSFRN